MVLVKWLNFKQMKKIANQNILIEQSDSKLTLHQGFVMDEIKSTPLDNY